jgi:hypothetical protein
MKKKLFALLVILLFPFILYADVDTFDGQTGIDTWDGQTGIDTVDGQTVSGGGGCGTFSADFEGEIDETELSAITAAWTEAPVSTNYFVVDTAQANGGSASARLLISPATQELRVYRTYAEQNGTYDLSFYFRWNDNSDSYIEFIALTDGDFSWNSTITATIYVSTVDGSLFYHNGSSWTDTTIDISADTWTKITIISDLTADTFDIEINDSPAASNLTMQSSGLSPDRVYLEFNAGTGSAGTIWVDDLCIP